MQILASYLEEQTVLPPTYVVVDTDLLQQFQGMWNQSGGGTTQAREVGTALELYGNGEFTVSNIRSGWLDGFTLLSEEIQRPRFVGYFHTHPYEEGYQGIAFSGDDFAEFIAQERMKILFVQSGQDVFLLVRTKSVSSNVETFLQDFENMIQQEYNEIIAEDQDKGRAMALAVLSTNEEYASRLGIAFFAGAIETREDGSLALSLARQGLL